MRRTKKTTLLLDDAVFQAIRKEAAEQNSSMSSIVSEAVRRYMASKPSGSSKPFRITTYGGNGFVAPVDPFSNADVEEYLDLQERRSRL